MKASPSPAGQGQVGNNLQQFERFGQVASRGCCKDNLPPDKLVLCTITKQCKTACYRTQTDGMSTAPNIHTSLSAYRYTLPTRGCTTREMSPALSNIQHLKVSLRCDVSKKRKGQLNHAFTAARPSLSLNPGHAEPMEF